VLHLGGSPVHVVLQDAHGEPAGTVGQGLPDPAEAHDARRRVMHVSAQHHERPPDPGRTRADEPAILSNVRAGSKARKPRKRSGYYARWEREQTMASCLTVTTGMARKPTLHMRL
jgi:hypothetical protein